jgi:hypothetical protein
MRTFSITLLCLLFLTFGKAHAQETFAPLISDNCVLFVHADFSKIEIDALKTRAKQVGETLLIALNFDKRSAEVTLRELDVELEKLDVLARPVFDTITKELGIKECAFIVNGIPSEDDAACVIALPWKNKTDEDIQTLENLFEMAYEYAEFDTEYSVTGDFLLLSDDKSDGGSIVQGWLEEKSSSPAILEALKSTEGSEIKIAFTFPPALRDMLKDTSIEDDMPVQVRNLFLLATQKINWASAGVSLHEILGGEAPENADVLLTIKTAKRSDAVMLRGMLEQLIEFGTSAGQFAAQQNPDVQVPPLAFQFGKGLLRTLLPDVEEEKLVFRMKGKNAASKQAVVSAVGVGAALLIPAIQSAREAARRMQCAGNIKQIVLAIHNYHDAYNALPPLYSVDKNGKPLHSWRVLLLPFIEQAGLYSQIRLDEPWDSEHNKQFHDRVIPTYNCPSNPNPRGMTSYSAIAGQVFVPAKKSDAAPFSNHSDMDFSHITDGTSNTIAIVEVKEPFCWMDPTADITLEEFVKGINNGLCGSYHPGGINVGMLDGTTSFIGETVDPVILRCLAMPDDGTSVGL